MFLGFPFNKTARWYIFDLAVKLQKLKVFAYF